MLEFQHLATTVMGYGAIKEEWLLGMQVSAKYLLHMHSESLRCIGELLHHPGSEMLLVTCLFL